MLPEWFAVNSSVVDGKCYKFIRNYVWNHSKKTWERNEKKDTHTKKIEIKTDNNDSNNTSEKDATDVLIFFGARMKHTEYFITSHNFMWILNNHND